MPILEKSTSYGIRYLKVSVRQGGKKVYSTDKGWGESTDKGVLQSMESQRVRHD